jgi:hypothetical protein
MLVDLQRIRESMAGIPERQSWPDLVGKTSEFATNVIKQDRPDLRVINYLEGHDPEPEIEEFDRVIIWCFVDSGSNFIVNRVPTQG